MSPERDEEERRRTADRKKIETGGKKSLEEVRVGTRICPFWVHEAVIDIWKPDKTKKDVNYCMATARSICLRDFKNYDNCEYYLQFKKSEEENVPPSAAKARFPVNPQEGDAY